MRGERRYAALLALVPAVLVPFGAALYYFMLCRDAVVSRRVYAAAKIFLVAWPFVATRVILGGRAPPWRGRDGRWQAALAAGAVSGLGISLFVVLVMLSPLGRLVMASAGPIRERCEHLGILQHYWLFAIFLSLIHSLVEEYYWRWFVYRRLRAAWPRWTAALVSSAAFASHHVIVTGQLMSWPLGVLCGAGIMVGGVIWCLQYERRRSILAPWLSHALVDVTVMTIGWIVLQG